MVRKGRLRRIEREAVDGCDEIRIGPLSFALAIGPVMYRPGRVEPSYDSAMPPVDEYPDATEEFLSLGGEGEEIGLKTEVIENVLVITPLLPTLDGDREIDAFRDTLLSLFDRRFPRRELRLLRRAPRRLPRVASRRGENLRGVWPRRPQG